MLSYYKSSTQSGFRVKEKVSVLTPLLLQWIQYLERFCVTVTGDVPYWYSERTTVGTLAAAAWAVGGFALEEFSTTKSEDEGRDRRGRGDLLFCVDGHIFLAECKVDWRWQDEQIAQFKEKLEQASADVSVVKNPNESAYPESQLSRLGIVFSSPQLWGFPETPVQKSIETFRDEVWLQDVDLIAWSLPYLDAGQAPRYGNIPGYWHPGVLFAAKVVPADLKRSQKPVREGRMGVRLRTRRG